MIRAVLVRPWLWPTVAATAWRFRPDGGLIPPPEFRAFRASIYGTPLHMVPAGDVVGFLRWCRRHPKTRTGGR